MTLKGTTSQAQACAACKYQRRKCTSECQLAPFFPADKPELFKNAHRLYGVKNILNILKSLPEPSMRSEAMTSIINESNIREMFPVRGSMQVIEEYWARIHATQMELSAVKSQLEFFRQQHQYQEVPNSVLQLGMAPPNNDDGNAVAMFPSPQQSYADAIPLAALPQAMHPSYYNANNVDFLSSYMDMPNQNHSFFMQNSYTNTSNNDSIGMVGPISGSASAFHKSLAAQGIQEDDYEDVHPFFESIDERQSYIGSNKDACDSSSEVMGLSKDHLAESELKNAAACFTLTSIT